MRIVVVSHLALPHIGGVEVLVDTEIRALAAAGHDVVLVTSDGAGAAQTPAYPASVRVVRVAATHLLERRYRLPYPLFSPRLVAILAREIRSADVVHVHGSLFMSSVAALLLARLFSRECILTDHGGVQRFESRFTTLAARIGMETVGRLSARSATRLVAYNTRVTRLLERLAGYRTRAVFLPNPVDRDRFRPPTALERRTARAGLGWSVDRHKVLFVGRLTPDKGVCVLLQATDPSYDIVFCGPGDPAVLGPLPRVGVEYLPARPQPDLVRLYHAADVLALPSTRREGFPLVVQEAVACGLAVVMTYDEGYEPYRGMPGLVFSDRDPAAIKRALLHTLVTRRSTSSGPVDAGDWCPAPALWLRRLYGEPEVSQRSSRPSSSRAFQAR